MDFNENNNINEEGISISELWDIFRARFAWFLVTLILVVAAAFVYLQYVIPQYSSTVTVLVEPITTSSSLDDLMLTNLSSSSSKISTEVALIKSRANVDAALQLLDLTKYKNSEGLLYSDFYQLGRSLDFISVSAVQDTKLVAISVTNENPQFAADFANALSISYDSLLTNIAKNSKTSQREFLEEQIPINEDELKTASDKLSDYKEESGVLQLTERSSLLVNQISYYELRKEPLKLQKIEAESKMTSVSSALVDRNIILPTLNKLTSDSDFVKLSAEYKASESELIMYDAVNLSSATDVSSKGVNSRTSELSSSVSSVSKQMLDNINKQLSIYNNDDVYISALLNEYSKAVINIKMCDIGIEVLEERATQFNNELDQLPIIERKVSELQRDVTVLQQIGVQLRTMLEEVKLVEAAVTGNVTLVDKATVSESPVSPNKLLILAVALLLGAALGFLLALVIDMTDNTIKTTEQVRKLLRNTKIPLLGWIPLTKNKTLNPLVDKNLGYKSLSVYKDPTAFDSEKYMAIVSHIIYSNESKKRTIVVTSCDISEGKSTLVANMALCLVSMGNRVLLVDGDFRMPSIEAKFGYSRTNKGLVNLVQDENVKIKDIILQPIEDVPLLHLLPPGRLPLVPAAILTSPKLDKISDLLGTYYDFILIDAPPLEYASEVITLGERADSLVINIRANVTTKPALRTLIQSLDRIEDKISGVVLNSCLIKDAESTANFGTKYGYGYGYNSKHFYGPEKSAASTINSRHKALRLYKQSLKYRKIRDSDWQKKTPVAPLANVDVNLNKSTVDDFVIDNVVKENLAKENLAKENLAKENLAKENLAKENLAKENLAKENLAKENLAKENLAKENLAKENLAKENLAKENLAKAENVKIDYDSIFEYLENDPLASGKNDDEDSLS